MKTLCGTPLNRHYEGGDSAIKERHQVFREKDNDLDMPLYGLVIHVMGKVDWIDLVVFDIPSDRFLTISRWGPYRPGDAAIVKKVIAKRRVMRSVGFDLKARIEVPEGIRMDRSDLLKKLNMRVKERA